MTSERRGRDHAAGAGRAARRARAPGDGGPAPDRRAHPVRARARRPQGERRVPHRQGGPGPPGDAHLAPGRAPAQRARRRPGGGRHRRRLVRLDRPRRRRGVGPRRLLHARRRDRGRPARGSPLGRVAGGQGAAGRAGGRRCGGRRAGRGAAAADRAPRRLEGAPMAAPDEADALYGLPLEEFVAQRDALAKRLRGEGRREEAAAVKELAKPSVAAWGVNQAVRARAREARELWAAGDALAAAQAALLEGRGDAEALREAARAEQDARRPLVEAARGLLTGRGRSLGDPVLERVDETLHAAAVDPGVRADVAAGCAAHGGRRVGLGPLVAADGPATRPSPGRTRRGGRGAGGSRRAPARRPAPGRGRPSPAGARRGGGAAGERGPARTAVPAAGERERAERERREAERREELAQARRAVKEAEAAYARAELDFQQAERAVTRAGERLEQARRTAAEARETAEAAARERRRRGDALDRARDTLADLR